MVHTLLAWLTRKRFSQARFFHIVGGEPFLSEIVPIAQQLADDPVINVRKAVAEMIVDISAKCGEESSARLMNDLVIKVMEDEEPLVRLRIIRKIHILADEKSRLLIIKPINY